MSRVLRTALLIAASMTAGLVVNSTAAYAADTTTSLTLAEMKAALKVVSTASTAAAQAGWRGTDSIAGGSSSGTGTYVVDPVGGVASVKGSFSGYTYIQYAVQKKGTYTYAADGTTLAAVKMIGRPAVRYVFAVDKKLALSAWVDKSMPAPSRVLTSPIAAGTKTAHDDGSADYKFTADVGSGDSAQITLHVDAAGLLSTATGSMTGFKETLAYTYGAQKVTLPAAAATIDSATLVKAKAYLKMVSRVQTAATNGAAHTRKAAKGKKVKVASLRAIVRKDAASVNKSAGAAVVKVSNIAGGVRVFATNPWTHKTVAYTVKASGKKVVVKKV
jgi:hypothetical protein